MEKPFLETLPDIIRRPDQKELEVIVQELEKTNRQIDIEVKVNNNILLKAISKGLNMILSTKQKPLDELRDKQLRSVYIINSYLEAVNEESRKEQEAQEQRYEEISIELEERIKNRKPAQLETFEAGEEYLRLRAHLETTPKLNPDYFPLERQTRKKAREFRELKHEYILNNETISMLKQQKKSLEATEIFSESSLHISERIQRQTFQLRNHLEITKRANQLINTQHTTISTLQTSVKKIANSSQNLETELGNSLIKISKIINDNEIGDFYKNPSLQDKVYGVNFETNFKDKEVDKMIDDYLKKKTIH